MPKAFFASGTDEVDVHLVHHTGRMIRFRPSLRSVIPHKPRAVEVVLPDGSIVQGRLTPNPKNPYIGGRELVEWIRKEVPSGCTKPARLGELSDGRLNVVLSAHSLADVPHTVVPGPLRPKVQRLRGQQDRTKLRRSLEVWERDPRLRQWALELWPAVCQIRGCRSAEALPESLRSTIVEIHHLTHVSSGGSDDPLNLCVLCATHHRLVHRAPHSEVEHFDDQTVVVHVNGVDLAVERDLEPLFR